MSGKVDDMIAWRPNYTGIKLRRESLKWADDLAHRQKMGKAFIGVASPWYIADHYNKVAAKLVTDVLFRICGSIR